ncbi:MAG: YceI family protein [Sphingomonadales bacterium]|nr:YceI family protein [Sphingomonadales bacterium]
MKKTLFYVAGIAALSMLASCGGNSQKSENADTAAQAGENAGTYTVDAAGSNLEWRGWKIVATGEHKGTIGIKEGSLSVEGGKVVAGSFVIDMNSIKNTDLTDTGYQKKLVGHLMAEDFFNVAKFPTGKFEIVSVEEKASEGNTHEVSGNLTLRDSTRKITFPATIKVEGNTVTATGKATINRLEWGINYDSKNLGLAEAAQKKVKDGILNKEIEITISLKATK